MDLHLSTSYLVGNLFRLNLNSYHIDEGKHDLDLSKKLLDVLWATWPLTKFILRFNLVLYAYDHVRFITKNRAIKHGMGPSEAIKENKSKSREFYEFVLPPIDMYLGEDSLRVVIDIPGFAKDDIELTLCGNILSIKAHKRMDEKESETLVSSQRPSIIDKKVRLPIEIRAGEEIKSARYEDGILTLVMPVTKKEKNIPTS